MIIPVTWVTMAGSCLDDSTLRLAKLLAGEEESSRDWKIGVWAVGTPLSAGQDGYVRKCTVDSVKCAILYGVPSSLYCSRGHALTLGNTWSHPSQYCEPVLYCSACIALYRTLLYALH